MSLICRCFWVVLVTDQTTTMSQISQLIRCFRHFDELSNIGGRRSFKTFPR
ncbi:hypothetical protein BHM03_00050294 [Ensete ventricosum]|nr:hypothetical protein BHM03_00050294 [Ensete ventricosum]